MISEMSCCNLRRAGSDYCVNYISPGNFADFCLKIFPQEFRSVENTKQDADYMEIFNPDWNFNSVYRPEISSRLNSKFLFKMTLQLHVKLSTRYTWLKFQLGSAKQMKFQRGMKILNFPYNRHSFQPGLKIWYYARKNALFIFKKIKMTTCSQARF